MKEKRFERKYNNRIPYRFIYIFTEGEKTEVNYFEAKKEEISSEIRRNNIRVEINGTGRNTMSIVDYALNYIEINKININPDESIDECWVVFDLDDFKKDFDNAISRATANNLQVAYSNESFELWYLLHFSYFNSAIRRNIYINKLTENLKELTKDKKIKYDKAALNMYSLIGHKEKDAIRNAKKLIELHSGEKTISRKNPSTSVYLLVESLNKLKNE